MLLFGTDLMGTRPTYLGIGRTLLADKGHGMVHCW